MEKSFFKSKDGQKVVTALCIVGCYIVMYGLLMLFMSVFENSTPAFLIFLVISMFFAYKSCKGALVNSLSSLPWPAFIVLVIMLSAVIGCFTAPYHIGKWIARKVNHTLSSLPDSGNTTPNSYTDETLRKMSIEELDKLHLNLAHLVMPTFDEPATKRIPVGKQAYGCKTWGEARNLMDLVAKIHNEKLPKKQ